MSDWNMMVAFAALVAGILASRRISERAFRQLDDATKQAVLTVFSSVRIWSVLPLAALLLLLVAGRTLFSGHSAAVLIGFFLCLAVYLPAIHILVSKKMRSANVPEDYLRAFMRARWFSYLTAALMIVLLSGERIIAALRG